MERSIYICDLCRSSKSESTSRDDFAYMNTHWESDADVVCEECWSEYMNKEVDVFQTPNEKLIIYPSEEDEMAIVTDYGHLDHVTTKKLKDIPLSGTDGNIYDFIYYWPRKWWVQENSDFEEKYLTKEN
jgi:hypothetical protein